MDQGLAASPDDNVTKESRRATGAIICAEHPPRASLRFLWALCGPGRCSRAPGTSLDLCKRRKLSSTRGTTLGPLHSRWVDDCAQLLELVLLHDGVAVGALELVGGVGLKRVRPTQGALVAFRHDGSYLGRFGRRARRASARVEPLNDHCGKTGHLTCRFTSNAAVLVPESPVVRVCSLARSARRVFVLVASGLSGISSQG